MKGGGGGGGEDEPIDTSSYLKLIATSDNSNIQLNNLDWQKDMMSAYFMLADHTGKIYVSSAIHLKIVSTRNFLRDLWQVLWESFFNSWAGAMDFSLLWLLSHPIETYFDSIINNSGFSHIPCRKESLQLGHLAINLTTGGLVLRIQMTILKTAR